VAEGTHGALPAGSALRKLGDIDRGALGLEVEDAEAVGLVDLEEVAEEGLLSELNDLGIRTVELEASRLATHHDDSNTINLAVQSLGDVINSFVANFSANILDHLGARESLVLLIVGLLIHKRKLLRPLIPDFRHLYRIARGKEKIRR
jgi:hypothetical protein